MQSIEITIKGNAGEPMVLVFAAADAPETVAERLRTLTWIVQQVNSHALAPRRRGPRHERSSTAPEPPVES